MSDVMRHKPSKKMYYVFYKSLVALQDVFFKMFVSFVCFFCLVNVRQAFVFLWSAVGFFSLKLFHRCHFCSVSLLLLTLTLPEASEVLN